MYHYIVKVRFAGGVNTTTIQEFLERYAVRGTVGGNFRQQGHGCVLWFQPKGELAELEAVLKRQRLGQVRDERVRLVRKEPADLSIIS